jgi:DNA-binding GntR family transcriptional regulator
MTVDALSAKIDRRLPTTPQVFDVLRQAIVSLKIGIGQPLSENEVAVQLGVSRTPVREAFIKLAGTGLIEVLPQRGTFVVKISPRAVRDAQFVREALEVGVVRQACLHPVPDLAERLWELIAFQKSAAEDEDFDRFLIHDEAFHKTMANAVDRERAWRVIESEKGQMDRVRYLSLPKASPMFHLIGQHEAITVAIEERNLPAAEQALASTFRDPGRSRTLPAGDAASFRRRLSLNSSLKEGKAMDELRIVDIGRRR